MRQDTILELSGVSIDTPSGRPLFRDLHLALGYEKVAVIGRNGVGKSTLLRCLAGDLPPKKGRIRCHGTSLLVQQDMHFDETVQALRSLRRAREERMGFSLEQSLEALGLESYEQLIRARGFSVGQQRKIALLSAWMKQPDLLILDEPTEALDQRGRAWLVEMLQSWSRGLIVVSHDRSLLRCFEDFFIIGESGGRYFQGTFEALEEDLEEAASIKEKKYLRNLQHLEEREWHNARVCRRRARKKNLGRIHEVGRSPSRALLNTNRSYAQVSQGRAAKIRKQRMESVRAWAKSTRQALDARLSLELAMPSLPPDDGHYNILLEDVDYSIQGRELFSGLSLRVGRERVAIQGDNGAGKTTLLRLMLGDCEPVKGRARRRYERIGSIAQDATNWMTEENLVTLLGNASGHFSLDDIAKVLVAHKFPLSLAQRPLTSLSPGERLRAALICLFERSPTVECLVLDEPTYSLDFIGIKALRESLALWPGGLVVVSHDDDFLQAIGIEHRLFLGQEHSANNLPLPRLEGAYPPSLSR